MWLTKIKSIFLLSLILVCFTSCTEPVSKTRVLISTDIGGSDPDDFQSMVHLLLYADTLDIVGLVSSPPHKGRKKHILEVIDAYEKDHPKLKKHSTGYPSPDYLRSITSQGAIEPQKFDTPDTTISEGAQYIIDEAKKGDSRPLYILVWGSITDVAQALQAAPEIKSKIRVYFIGSWNTRQDPLARDYVYNEHPDLWLIENNTTFRGMYMGGYQEKNYGNESFVWSNIKDRGALGNLFYQKKKDIKMGDTPAVLYLLHGDPENPESESWGGRFLKTEHGANYFTDLQQPQYREGDKSGAKTVNKWRREYLDDWKKRQSVLSK